MANNPLGNHVDVTVVIPTRDRYFTTLPLTIVSIAMQTVKPKHLIIYDDGAKMDLRQNATYRYIFETLDSHGIKWQVKFGEDKGQAILHDRSIKDSETEFIWRIDDDCVAEPETLATLLGVLKSDPKNGAVGGIVAEPNKLVPKPSFLNGTLDDAMLGHNIQWYASYKSVEVEHLYSSFLYRKEASSHGYRKDLSRASHREETIFTHQMHLNGWKLVFTPNAITWHYRNAEGGIRLSNQAEFAHDENVFNGILMLDWKIKWQRPEIIVLDSGIGDHYAFKHILPDLIKKHAGKRIILAVCYPGVFHDCYCPDVELTSIRDASFVTDIHKQNVYKFMADNNWKANLVEAYKKLYQV